MRDEGTVMFTLEEARVVVASILVTEGVEVVVDEDKEDVVVTIDCCPSLME